MTLHYRAGHGISGVARKTDGAPSDRDYYRILAINQPEDDPELSLLIETVVIIHCNLADTAELRRFYATIGHTPPKVDFLATNIECGLRGWFGGYSNEQHSRGGRTTASNKRLRNKTVLFGDELVS